LTAILLVLTAASASADVLYYDFHYYQDVEFDTPWVDQGLNFVIESTGSHPLAESGRYGLSLGTVVLSLDLSPLDDVHRVDIEIKTFSDPVLTMIALFDDEGMVDGVTNEDTFRCEVLTVESGGANVHWLRISSTQSLLETLIVHYGTVAGDTTTWSRIKTLYR